ncbi:TrkH family potassium uptake protein [Paradesertivirga mongoliensis]|uniref:TrkH family potassium uptake protein n=1 Tax=Paradesertivirga mongoliensis TaxID=2100740 RepID=A0ABW4ZLK2_9SPHI|nr:potassium transporter TrkG [Pedobacter mongoliensis]
MAFAKKNINPTLLFVISFLFLIAMGTAFLMLPASAKSTNITLTDAIFMSASAVCVTGLAVIDISIELSRFGQCVILLLIQLGGLGIMTFTSFFGFLLSGQASYKNQLMFSELLSDKNIGSVIGSLVKIVLITFFFELLGTLFILFSSDPGQFNSLGEHLFFSMFHSISAFCNAGFSTLSLGLYDESLRYNYPFQFVIASLLILGGLGFTIILNIQLFIKRWAQLLFHRVWLNKPIKYKAWVMTFNSKLIAYTTIILLVFGFVMFFILEYNNTLASHSTITGKLVTAFFLSATPRTAGFNTVDMSTLAFPTILITMLLMWIGASPGSTGGGIRTTTFAVAVLNIINVAKNHDRIHVFKRQISSESIKKSFAIICLSFLWLGVSIFFLSITDGEKGLTALAFESFSAYSTVGLSLGITPGLSTSGKLLIACTMFLGRVGTITLLVALIKSIHTRYYQYPSEHVIF